MDLTCKEVVELVTDYLESELDPAVSDALNAHARGCAGCTEYVAQMRNIIEMLQALAPPQAPPELHHAATRAFHEHHS